MFFIRAWRGRRGGQGKGSEGSKGKGGQASGRLEPATSAPTASGDSAAPAGKSEPEPEPTGPLLALPKSLLDEILEHVTRQRDRAALVCCCRTLRAALERDYPQVKQLFKYYLYSLEGGTASHSKNRRACNVSSSSRNNEPQ